MARDEFPNSVKEQLAKRVGLRCSNPECRQQTCGPQSESDGVASIGVAAHITGASPGGPRFNAELATADRTSPDNGIWLCQTCARLIDVDVAAFPAELLREWKAIAEATALLELRGLRVVPDLQGVLAKLEREMPDLFAEMREDLQVQPFCREFILISKKAMYSAGNNPVLAYHFEQHPHLRQKVRILENRRLVSDITFNNVDRFTFSEELVEYLKRDA